jgi:hypothetical protein
MLMSQLMQQLHRGLSQGHHDAARTSLQTFMSTWTGMQAHPVYPPGRLITGLVRVGQVRHVSVKCNLRSAAASNHLRSLLPLTLSFHAHSFYLRLAGPDPGRWEVPGRDRPP